MMRWVKEYMINVELLAFYLFCVFIANYYFPQKNFLLSALIIIVLIESIRNWEVLGRQVSYLTVAPEFSNVNKIYVKKRGVFISITGIFSLLSVVAFYFSTVFFAFNSKDLALGGILFFMIFTIITFFSVLIEYYSPVIGEINKIKWVFGAFSAIAFPCSYALADSIFLHEASMSLSDSPWISYTLKATYFILLSCFFFQIFFFCFYLKILDGLSVVQRIAFLMVLGLATLLMNASLFSLNNLTYFVIDNGVRFEWREQAYCQGKNVAKKGDYYFGFDQEDYVGYHSDGKLWGFYKLICPKENDGGQESILPISNHPVRKWIYN
ncbi:hypothetical protein CYR40_00125 [Chimaeribacter arupi]|uniref:hypothetical protein n=1 Tax=Chimaeribacter arupi TaxID=2060066 RepID=UPI000C7C21E0|nr:hypothetical protein [Chimaeribacter arupi]PLR50761.1 hypothetical protein CYR40_00125 [Chimaeribacter arupi]